MSLALEMHVYCSMKHVVLEHWNKKVTDWTLFFVYEFLANFSILSTVFHWKIHSCKHYLNSQFDFNWKCVLLSLWWHCSKLNTCCCVLPYFFYFSLVFNLGYLPHVSLSPNSHLQATCQCSELEITGTCSISDTRVSSVIVQLTEGPVHHCHVSKEDNVTGVHDWPNHNERTGCVVVTWMPERKRHWILQ